MTKKELRKKYTQLRNELTAQQISEWSLDISDSLINSFNQLTVDAPEIIYKKKILAKKNSKKYSIFQHYLDLKKFLI